MTSSENFETFETDEAEIIANKKANRIYVADFQSGEGKYISTVIGEDSHNFDLKARISPKVEVRITYITNKNRIEGVKISKLKKDGNIQEINLSTLTFEGILGLLKIFSNLDLNSINNRALVLDSNIVKDPSKLQNHLNTILADERGLAILSEVAKSKGLIFENDIGNIKRKREALELFAELLGNDSFFEEQKKDLEKNRDEGVWQSFFEKNKWIFGYGLEYIFNAPIKKEKYEQTLIGANFLSSGKRPDGILKTLGLTQFLNIVEIKTHKHNILENNEYRAKAWRISSELSGAIAQCQQYVHNSMKNLQEYIELKDLKGNRINEEVFNFQPKCFLVIGNMHREFVKNGKVLNPDRLSCFECFRKNLLSPQIITYDQLYYRAKYIIEDAQ